MTLTQRAPQNPTAQELPPWLSYSLITIPGGTSVTGASIIQLPLTYYGPSIPLGTDGLWVYGGLTPPASTSTPTPTSSTTITTPSLSPSPSPTATPTSLPSTTPLSSQSISLSPTSSIASSTAHPSNSAAPQSGVSTDASTLLGIILGAVFGCLILLGLLILAFCLRWRRRLRQPRPSPMNQSEDERSQRSLTPGHRSFLDKLFNRRRVTIESFYILRPESEREARQQAGASPRTSEMRPRRDFGAGSVASIPNRQTWFFHSSHAPSSKFSPPSPSPPLLGLHFSPQNNHSEKSSPQSHIISLKDVDGRESIHCPDSPKSEKSDKSITDERAELLASQRGNRTDQNASRSLLNWPWSRSRSRTDNHSDLESNGETPPQSPRSRGNDAEVGWGGMLLGTINSTLSFLGARRLSSISQASSVYHDASNRPPTPYDPADLPPYSRLRPVVNEAYRPVFAPTAADEGILDEILDLPPPVASLGNQSRYDATLESQATDESTFSRNLLPPGLVPMPRAWTGDDLLEEDPPSPTEAWRGMTAQEIADSRSEMMRSITNQSVRLVEPGLSAAPSEVASLHSAGSFFSFPSVPSIRAPSSSTHSGSKLSSLSSRKSKPRSYLSKGSSGRRSHLSGFIGSNSSLRSRATGTSKGSGLASLSARSRARSKGKTVSSSVSRTETSEHGEMKSDAPETDTLVDDGESQMTELDEKTGLLHPVTAGVWGDINWQRRH